MQEKAKEKLDPVEQALDRKSLELPENVEAVNFKALNMSDSQDVLDAAV